MFPKPPLAAWTNGPSKARQVGPAADVAALAKLAKYCEQSLLYMGHMLRCCVQQAHINARMASLHDNPTHVQMVVDYKVSWGGAHA